MLQHVGQLAHALQVYLDRQATPMPAVFEGVLVTTNPAAHIEVTKPMVWVVTSTAVKHFVAMLAQSMPVLKSSQMAELVNHIVGPEREAPEPESLEAGEYRESTTQKMPAEEEFEEKDTEQAPARARAIFRAAEELKPPDLAGAAGGGGRRFGGLTVGQWVLLAFMLLVEIGIVGALAYLVYFNAP